MIGRTPPPFAAWLLKRLTQNDALVGDVAESYAHGQSGWWYGRQVVAIIAASISTEIRRHPIITMRSIAVGFAFTWAMWRYYVMGALINYDEVLFRTGLTSWFYIHDLAAPRLAIWPATAVLYGLSGWIVARASRDRAAVVLLYAVMGEFLFIAVWGMWRFVYDPVVSRALLIFLTLVVRPLPALAGGLWAVSRGHSVERQVHA
jgi:hypothetical protein